MAKSICLRIYFDLPVADTRLFQARGSNPRFAEPEVSSATGLGGHGLPAPVTYWGPCGQRNGTLGSEDRHPQP